MRGPLGSIGRMLAVAIAVLGCLQSVEAAAPRHVARVIAGHPSQARVELSVLGLLNADRAHYGLAPLRLSPRLCTLARLHSQDMALHHYFGHTSSDGRNPFQRMSAARIGYLSAGENVGMAAGYPPLRAVGVINAQMMAEPPKQVNHRWIILNRALHKVGVGIFVTSSGGLYLTEDFIN